MATTWQPAVIIRFTGPRFDAITSDFDVASELAALKALVVKVAEGLWRARNPSRSRFPKSLAEGALLRFREVKRAASRPDSAGADDRAATSPPSSAVFLLERGCEGAEQLTIPVPGTTAEDDFDHALGLALAAVRATRQDEPLPAAFPKQALSLFGAWGSGFGEDDRCELYIPGALDAIAEYGQRERVKLLRLIEGEGLDVTAEVGYVPSIGRNRFELYTDIESGEGIDVPLSPEHAPVVLEASREYGRVLVRGLGVFDAEGKLTRFVHVDAIELVDNPPLWGGAQAFFGGLPALSKCGLEDRWSPDRMDGAENLNAYIYGIGR